jgi:hypothetical protein
LRSGGGSQTLDGVKIADQQLALWRDRLERARRDREWAEHWARRTAGRLEALPQMRQLLDDFVAGTVSLEELRSQYDRKTRREWDYFGFKGFGGGMFLNMIAKHLPEEAGAADVLRAVLPKPADDATAKARLEHLREYLRRYRAEGVLSERQAAEANIPFFVSAWWHIQEPDVWPAFYASVRTALAKAGLVKKGDDPIASYFELRETFTALRDALGLETWGLEALCAWEEPAAPEIDEEDEGRAPRQRVWLVSPGRNAEHWEQQYADGIIAIGWGHLGDLSSYETYEEVLARLQELSGSKHRPTNDAYACFQFAHEMQPGDVVVAKKGRRHIVGYGRVTGKYRYEAEREHYRNVRSVDWQHKGEWMPRERSLVLETLTDITPYPELVRQIQEVIGVSAEDAGDVDEDPIVDHAPSYDLEHACADLFIDRNEIERALSLLRYKKNLVLQGPPGVGKTFVARRLAYLLLGEKDPERVSVVQFHQSYSYEDFVQGYRPQEGAFVRRDGPFLRLCNLARQDLEQPYVLIIDEINRGNLSKVLGELMMLIEADKRSSEWAVSLAYGTEDERFWVPPNLYIIGTMNTADRSLAMVDYALRRRFAFFDVAPGFGSPNFATTLHRLGADPGLRAQIQAGMAKLNDMIRKDPSLGEGFEIGHSYFCAVPAGASADQEWFANIVRFEIEPLLREYWFDAAPNVASALALIENEVE